MKARGMSRLLNLISAMFLTCVAASCGGGSSTVASNGGGVGSGGTGITLGSVTGFGSVLVNGFTYNSATPVYLAGSDADEAVSAPSTSLQLGSQIEATLDAQGNPSQIRILPALVGTVQQLNVNAPAGSTSFTVNGLAVRFNTDATLAPLTFFAGLPGLGGMANGMRVEVHGALGLDSNNQSFVLASLVRLLPPSNTQLRISGPLSQLTASTFQVGTQTVSYANASVLPTGQALTNGAWVNIWSNQPVSGGTIQAGTIRIRTLMGASGTATVSGLITSIQGNVLSIAGIPVDAGSASLISTLSELAIGNYVTAQGNINATSSQVVASSVQRFSPAAATVSLQGTITGYVSDADFLVRGVTVNAAPLQLTPGTLGNGVYVVVHGTLSGSNQVQASSLQVASTMPTDGTVELRGSITSINPATHTLTLNWGLDSEGSVTMQNSSIDIGSNPALQYVNGNVSDLAAGSHVEVEGIWSGSTVQAYRITFLGQVASSASTSTLDTSGPIYSLTAQSFVVNGITISYANSVVSGGVLANGVEVEVSFDSTSHQALAVTIDN